MRPNFRSLMLVYEKVYKTSFFENMIHLPDKTVEFISKLIKTTLKFWKGHWK